MTDIRRPSVHPSWDKAIIPENDSCGYAEPCNKILVLHHADNNLRQASEGAIGWIF
jgi:hypothetical protein